MWNSPLIMVLTARMPDRFVPGSRAREVGAEALGLLGAALEDYLHLLLEEGLDSLLLHGGLFCSAKFAI